MQSGKNNLKVLILAGGMGKRLWPVSRKKWPKYLMRFEGQSLLQQAYDRVDVTDENKYIIGAQEAGFLVKREIEGIKGKNLVLEPLSRNTAPAIALGMCELDDEDIAVVLPADHIIKPKGDFREALTRAKSLAEDGFIVTIGIKPEYPATGYGYIKKAGKLGDGWKVKEFKEKPDEDTARDYFESGDYFWNAGIFVFKVSRMKREMEALAGGISKIFKELKEDKGNLREIYERIEGESIDYAVMEKTDKAAVVGFEGEWNDLGSWEAVSEVLTRGKENYSTCRSMTRGCRGSFAHISGKKFFAGAGVEDLIIVDTDDALLAVKKGHGQKVKDIVQELQGKSIVKYHREDYRPWGGYRVIEEGDGYKIKVLFVSPGERLSLQKHRYRDEVWTVVSGEALVTVSGKKKRVKAGETVKIPAGALHRAENTSDKEVKILELATGEKILEEDIERIEDDYNRQ